MVPALLSLLALGCTGPSNCSLNGICTAGTCVCDAPWSGPQCGYLEFATKSPAAGKDLANTAADPFHNTWNGPIVEDVETATYHIYVPLYPEGLLYHPVSYLHGTAKERIGPWSWSNLTGVDVSFNPGALQYTDTVDGKETMRYTIWITKPDGAALGKVYTSTSAAGPFVEVPNGENTGCYINPSPFMDEGTFYCTGQKGLAIMTSKTINGTWTEYASLPHRGEDPFIWIDARKNWHALFHTSGPADGVPAGTHCGNSSVASHHFSSDKGKTWSELDPPVQPYKPTVQWDDGQKPQTYATMERPHLYFDGAPGTTTGRATHLGVASTLNIGDEGCVNDVHNGTHFPGSKCKRAPCSCSTCKYVSHAGTLLIALA